MTIHLCISLCTRAGMARKKPIHFRLQGNETVQSENKIKGRKRRPGADLEGRPAKIPRKDDNVHKRSPTPKPAAVSKGDNASISKSDSSSSRSATPVPTKS